MSRQDFTTTSYPLPGKPSYRAYVAVANSLERIPQEASHLAPLRVAILRNFTLDSMIPVIKGEIALAGFHPQIYLGDFDAIARDVLDPESGLYAFDPHFVIVAQHLGTLAPDLFTRFPVFSPERVNAEIDRVLTTIGEMVAVLRRHSKAPILINNFPLPIYPALGILDAQSEDYQTHAILRLNLELLRLLRDLRDVHLVDYMSLMARVGSQQGVDERYWQIGKAPVGRHAVVPSGQEYGNFFRALRGKTRKCLVLARSRRDSSVMQPE
jgi:predicted enzyme involved in methoxymalonyl-ACP biosynthesis